MNVVTFEAGSGEISVQIPGEWVRQVLLEGGDKLFTLVEAIREMERFDFKHVVYPKLLKQREDERGRTTSLSVSVKKPPEDTHQHLFATIKKKLKVRGMLPYCLTCGELAPKEAAKSNLN